MKKATPTITITGKYLLLLMSDFMNKHYLLFVSVAYSYPILRPLQDEIRRRGDDVAWFVEAGCPILLHENETILQTISDVLAYNPIAIFAPGNYVYDFFPGVKVAVFHGYPIYKRGPKFDCHFSIRGWFDVYCTQGESSTVPYKKLEREYGFFKVYETGWCKADSFVNTHVNTIKNERPLILYSPTFTKNINSAPHLFTTIMQLAKHKAWDWIISFHPKYSDKEVINKYKQLAADSANVTFNETGQTDNELLSRADVMLGDASSVTMEFMLHNKPIVTYRNTMPGTHLINVTETANVEPAIEKALTRPADLMQNIRSFVKRHEAHLDGKSSARVLDAVDDYILNYQGRLKRKPLNLFRKIKLRRQTGLPLFWHLCNNK